MKKEAFDNVLRVKLRTVPLATRKTWKATDLNLWWHTVKADDPGLTWERASGDLWHHVRSMCQGLIGPDATE